MSAYTNTNTKGCLNPLADTNNHHFSGMTHNDQGLRAASHVSMEHTALAHEYNPTCPCHDCQDILSNFTQYHVLDAYTAEHLRFEASVQAAYGYVPAKGTPYDYAVRNVCVGQDENTGENIYEQQTEYANRYFFHFHLHQMNAIAPEVKERSYQRFFENNNNTNNHVAAAPAIPAPRYKQQQQYNNNKSGNGLARAFATHQNVHNNNNNNGRRNHHQQQSFNNNNNNNYASNNFQNYYAAPVPQQQYQQNNNAFYYTPSDVDQAAQDVAYNHVATLGN